jgi:phosphonate transport system substrate-binding protein
MADDSGRPTNPNSRRRFLLTGGAIGVTGLAGCTGTGGSSGSGGSEEAGAGLDSGGDSGGESDGGTGPNDPMLADSFDPTAPAWEEHNYLLSQLIENEYIRGRESDLEAMGSRDVAEVPHGNPVPEPPTDESEFVDPDTLVFVDQPGESGEAQFQENVQPLIDRLEETTGKTVEWQPVDSYAATVEALRSGRAHIGNVSTGTTAFAVNLADVVPFAVGIRADGAFGYRLIAITRDEMDDIQSVADFPEYAVTHTEPASNSGNQAPSALFDQYFDVTAGDDYEVTFSGGHDQSARGIAVGDYDCGPICSTCIEDLIEASDDITADDYKAVWASSPFPPGPVVHRYDLAPDLVENIKAAWLDTDWEGTAYEAETDYANFVEIDYKRHFYDIMVIQRYNGVEYESGNL